MVDCFRLLLGSRNLVFVGFVVIFVAYLPVMASGLC